MADIFMGRAFPGCLGESESGVGGIFDVAGIVAVEAIWAD